MNISIFGLGYVGAVSSACFSEAGHRVIGVDISKEKVDLINAGSAPIVEDGLGDLISKNVGAGNLEATQDIEYAVENSIISIVCVGTPSLINGSIDLSYIYKVIEQIGEVLACKDAYHTIVIRSTVSPGTVKICEEIVAATSGKICGVDFGVASNPEFLRESTAIKDFYSPPYTIIGTRQQKSEMLIKEMYSGISGAVYCLKPEESELIKYANNNFHAVKVTFANEIGNICKALGVDGHVVMDIVTKDKKLNLSPYYMKPGFAFGGSCLPKDVRGLTYKAKSLDIETPLLDSLNKSNEIQINRAVEMIQEAGVKKIGVLGFAFKAGTDDLRESPVVNVIETLIGRGYELFLFDSNVMVSALMGKNKSFIVNSIPHIGRLMCDSILEVIESSELVLIGNSADEFKEALNGIVENKKVIDLVRLDNSKVSEGNYVGICW